MNNYRGLEAATMDQLVHIAVQPLRQSTHEQMACPHSYVAQAIEGRRSPDKAASWRGTEVHSVMARYIAHCVTRKVPADWRKFNELASDIGNEAGTICDGIRDTYMVDWNHVVSTEGKLWMDEEFHPVYNRDHAAYECTQDVVYMLDEHSALIEDFKSHPQPFEPDTMQSLMYPVFLFQHIPTLQRVTSKLNFVRYRNCTRSVTWERSTDLSRMMDEMARSRARQKKYHALYAEDGAAALPAIPHSGCHYCPLLEQGDCPVADVNTRSEHFPDMVYELQYLRTRQAYLKALLKERVQATERPVVAYDANSTMLSFGSISKVSTQYPANALIDDLRQWAAATGDQAMLDGLRLSSTTIAQKLKTKKRSSLMHALEPKLLKVTKVKTDLITKNIGTEAYEDDEAEE